MLLVGPKEAARFWRNVRRDGPETCWPWIGSRNADGYGVFRRSRPDGRLIYAHRWTYQVCVGDLADGEDVHHACGNCCRVNPDHLLAVPAGEHRNGHGSGGRRRGTAPPPGRDNGEPF